MIFCILEITLLTCMKNVFYSVRFKGLLILLLGIAIFCCQSKDSQKTNPTQKHSIQVKKKLNKEKTDKITQVKEISKLLSKYPFKTTDKGIQWTVIDTGFYYAEMDLPKSFVNDSKASIVKINPYLYDLKMYNRSRESNQQFRTSADGWAKEKGLLLVVNAGMFDGENLSGGAVGETNRGLMIDYEYVNNDRIHPSHYMKSILAFNPKNNQKPPVKIIDLANENWGLYKDKYHSFTQCLRLIDARRQNVWFADNKKWSMVIVATDMEDSLLFIFTRSPYTMYQHIQNLLVSPLNLKTAMYLEGGPEASLYVSHNGFKVEKYGSYETGFFESDANDYFWELPNVLGVMKK
jgi:Phosphodiester glycosidase